ncbi:MAG: porin [Gammaproteobacteria bacterium]|nr:MAG: porin [Gammaproteobacteria bacterium]
MNQATLALAAAALLINAASVIAAPEIKFYGKANLSLNSVDNETDAQDEWQLNSNASRLGVLGQHAINEKLDAIVKIEYEVFVDDGQGSDNQAVKQRDIYAGLQGSFGKVIAGKVNTPLKVSQGKIDRFNDQEMADIKNVLRGEDRVNNIIMYTIPEFNGFSATAGIVPGETSKGGVEDAETRDGLADGTSISLHYKNDHFTAALARNDDINAFDTTRIVVDVKIAQAKIGFLIQTADESEGEENQDSWVLSAAINVDHGILLKAQYAASATSDLDEGLDLDTDMTQISVGIDKKLDKNNKLFAYYTNIESELGGDFSGTTDDSTFGIGYELKF